MQDCLELSKPKFHGDIHTYAYLAKPDKCLSCGLCAKACPTKVITMCKPNIIPEHLTKGGKGTMGKTQIKHRKTIISYQVEQLTAKREKTAV